MKHDRRSVLSAGFLLSVAGASSRALGQTAPPQTGRAVPPGLPQPVETIDLSLRNPAEYERLVSSAHVGIAGFGGAFLAMVGLKFFFDGDKDVHWIGAIERFLSGFSALPAAEIALLLLSMWGISLLLMWAVRRFFPSSWSYLWRQGLANLYRPNNQTVILVVSIGLGTAFICILVFVQSILLNRVTLSTSGNQPNMVLFDIQSAQKAGLVNLAQQYRLPATETVPIVNMRLEAIGAITAAKVIEDSTLDISLRVFSREYRVTFRDSLTSSEKITEGKWQGTVDAATGKVFISIEQGFAKRNNIDIGDTLFPKWSENPTPFKFPWCWRMIWSAPIGA